MAKTEKLICPECGAEMNHHATKVDYGAYDNGPLNSVFDGVLNEVHTCPQCGRTELRPAS